jgi:hypothetical protein
MASNSAVAAVEKGISPALDAAITLTKIGWQMSYWCSCWKKLLLLPKMAGTGAIAAVEKGIVAA